MKTRVVLIIVSLLFASYGVVAENGHEFYKNLQTGELLTPDQFDAFVTDMQSQTDDASAEEKHFRLHMKSVEESGDTIFYPFNYDLRVGLKYITRSYSDAKIGMPIPPAMLIDTEGGIVHLGGEQDKPTLINLWFTTCVPCIREMPALNLLKEKYGDRVNFVSMTYEYKSEVDKFLQNRAFNFSHIANANDQIQEISTSPYPENIFVGKDGKIRYIEKGIPVGGNIEKSIEYFSLIIEDLLGE